MGRGGRIEVRGVRKKGKVPPGADRKFAIALFVATVVGIAAVMLVNRIPEPKPPPAPAQSVAAFEGVVRIPLQNIRGGDLHFFEYAVADGRKVRFFVVEAPADHFRVALDASANASSVFHQYGNLIRCTHCDLSIDAAKVGAATGGCLPIPLAHRVVEQELLVRQDELVQAQRHFK